MEEYEVRDVTNRSSSPLLKLGLSLPNNPCDIVFKINSNVSLPIPIKITISNDAPTPAMYSLTRLHLDKRLQIHSTGRHTFECKTMLNVENASIEALTHRCGYSIPDSMPVWQGVSFEIDTIQVQLTKPTDYALFVIGWSVDSPGMSQQTGGYKLLVYKNQVHIVDPK